MKIEKVKLQENSWLVNESLTVPNSEGNRHYQMIQEWITDGGIVEPKYIIDPQLQINQDARAYLAETDWYVIRQTETNVECPAEILTARADARESII